MDLGRLGSSYPGFGCLQVTPSNPVSAEIDASFARFFANGTLENDRVQLAWSRDAAFSRLLRFRSDLGLILYARAGEALKGVASVSVRPGYVEGRSGWVADVADLRIEFERDLLRDWRRIYGDLLELLESWPSGEGVSGCVTALIRSNERALRALVQPHRNAPYRYLPLADFTMVNVAARAPFARLHALSTRISGRLTHRVIEADERDFERLVAFLDRNQRRRPFGSVFSTELPRRLREWPRLSLSTFFLVEDARGQVRAACAPWSPGSAKRVIAERLPLWTQRAARFLRRLPKLSHLRPPRIPLEGEAIEILYLTHLETDLTATRGEREAWLASLLDATLERHRDDPWHFVSFADFEADSLRGALVGSYYQPVPMSLFSVHRLLGDAIRKPIATGGPPPAFELALT